jgi:uncharacterized protein
MQELEMPEFDLEIEDSLEEEDEAIASQTSLNTKNLGPRLLVFCLGLIINSFGVALITKAGLGTSQISSVPYVLTFQFPWLSFAMATFCINIILILVQIVLLGRRFFPVQLLQIVVNVVFSSALGVSMSVLGWLAPSSLPLQLITLALGCCILGCGIAVECAPEVIFVPGEGVVYAISEVTGRKLGTVKLVFDAVLVIAAVTLSLALFGELRGVGVGTIVTVFITGNVVNFANAHFGFLSRVRSWAE